MTIPTMMKAIRIGKFGGPDVLREESIDVPVPARGQVLVRNEGAGINPVDYKIREGKYPAVRADMLPIVLGRDVSGIVVRSGPSSRFKEGDALVAMPAIERGGYAQYVLVKDEEAAARPASLDGVKGGAVPLASLTAWQGLFTHGGLQKGQRVLIHGGSGGVGHFAIQFAKAKGAHVATTVSGKNVNFARSLGADQVVDYKTRRFEDEVGEVDMVFDLIGGETQDRSWSVLKKGGILVSTLQQPSQEKASQRGARGMRYTARESGADLAEVVQLIDSGAVKPIVAKTFPLEQAADALLYLEKEHPAGKVVLTVG